MPGQQWDPGPGGAKALRELSNLPKGIHFSWTLGRLEGSWQRPVSSLMFQEGGQPGSTVGFGEHHEAALGGPEAQCPGHSGVSQALCVSVPARAEQAGQGGRGSGRLHVGAALSSDEAPAMGQWLVGVSLGPQDPRTHFMASHWDWSILPKLMLCTGQCAKKC